MPVTNLTISNAVAWTDHVVLYFNPPLSSNEVKSLTYRIDDAASPNPQTATHATHKYSDTHDRVFVLPPSNKPLMEGTTIVVFIMSGDQVEDTSPPLLVRSLRTVDVAGGLATNIASIAQGVQGFPGAVTAAGNSVGNQLGGVQKSLNEIQEWPVLTSTVDFSNRSGGGGGAGGSIAGAGTLGRLAQSTIQDVLGYRVKQNDPAGFTGALTQAFDLTTVEGHVEWKWKARSYAVRTDLNGGIAGPQASLYARAQDALEKSLPLLDGLRILDPAADLEDAEAYRALVKAQFIEVVQQLGTLGGPPVPRVDQLFGLLLLGTSTLPNAPLTTDPNNLFGAIASQAQAQLIQQQQQQQQMGAMAGLAVQQPSSLGGLRDVFGLMLPSAFVNSVDDETNVTNFRILADYITSLCNSWISNKPYLVPSAAGASGFMANTLVLLQRQLSVVSDAVDDARAALASVYIDDDEVATIQFTTANGGTMLLSDLFDWITTTVTDGSQIITQGGKIAVRQHFKQTLDTLHQLAQRAEHRKNLVTKVRGYEAPRVQVAMNGLTRQLAQTLTLAGQI